MEFRCFPCLLLGGPALGKRRRHEEQPPEVLNCSIGTAISDFLQIVVCSLVNEHAPLVMLHMRLTLVHTQC